ncbi:type III pantothenate kinase [uncultured Desulfovibrio sp.]|uniref:type III pantothenate kinase n=1 Tax=uncultured Desulfovibrio sp. TaxID=167968 RepID=UPI002621F725|nr:type III pantothenate kinase [uncultured Desulfovibrio sp.]
MQAELLLFDIGNTSIKVGLADASRVCTSYTLRTDTGQTSDSLGLSLLTLLSHAGVSPDGISHCVISSVVPNINAIVRACVARYIGCPVAFVPVDIPVPLENQYHIPSEVGADRLVGAYAARRLHPEPASFIVVDFGTAVTFDCVEGNAYRGGLIFPGPQTALSALARQTAQLPRVDLDMDATEPVIARCTSTSIQHGLYFGFVGMVESLCARLARQLPGDTAIYATGGFAQSIARVTAIFTEVFPSLLLEGLRRLHFESIGR